MAQNQSSSFLNHFQSGYGDRTINNAQIFAHHSNFYPNYVFGNGLISSEPTLVTPTTNFRFQHQNGHYFQSTRLLDATAFTHQGFGGRMTEVFRRGSVAASTVQVQRFMNYDFPMQYQPARPSSDIIGFSKARKTTQFLSTTSTLDRLLARNNIANGNHTLPNHCHPNFENQMLFDSNQANHRLTESNPFSSFYHQQNNRINRQRPRFSDLEENTDHQIPTRAILDPKPINTFSASQVRAGSNPSPNPNTTFDLQGIQSRQISNMDESSRNPVAIPRAVCDQRISQTNSNHSNYNDDGRTHSRCEKYGPYMCPKCEGEFPSSQKFARHVRSHYKSESPAEKKKRLAAKMKRKRKFHLVHSGGELTVVPVDEASTSDHAPLNH